MSDTVDTLFFKARELSDPEARARFLQGACKGLPELRAKVEGMLSAQEAAEAYFAEEAVGRDALATVVMEPVAIQVGPEEVGSNLGHYKLIELLGEGGFGSVWRAEQSHPVKRQVALKILKLGMDTHEVITRFEGERQALAMMEHPNIAKVFDAGTTGSGRPYFVMELVRGMPVTEFCNERRLPTRERLVLFREICSAVNHAHQKGIIHRDLKPSNVLVELVGEELVPKVIDFGIAKATESKLTEETLVTRMDQFIGTPVYMSPEQAALGGVDIDTRSDIYSLGVLLYELLTGIPPFDAKSLLSAGYDEMRRIIREEEPLKPSSRISSLEGDERGILCARHGIELGKLHRLVHGDLDWIVMKAIEKDRSRRYETSNALSADIGRYLANEPVTATPPSLHYKFGKFARRNRAVFAVVATIATALIGATAVSVWQTKLAREAARDAEAARHDASERAAAERAARENSDGVIEYLEEVFQSPAPGRDGLSVTVAETLDRAVGRLERDLAAQPGVRAHLERTLGETYLRLGIYDKAFPLLEEAVDYYSQFPGPEDRELIRASDGLASGLELTGKSEQALALFESNLQRSLDRVGAEDPLTIQAMVSLADSLSISGDHVRALRLLEDADRICRQEFGSDDSTTIAVMGSKATALLRAGRREEGVALLESALPLSREAQGTEDPQTLWILHNLSSAHYSAGRCDEALDLLKDAVAVLKKVYGPKHPTTLDTLHRMVSIYAFSGQNLEGLTLAEELLPVFREVRGRKDPDTIELARVLATTCYYAGRHEEALEQRAENLALSREVFGPEDVRTYRAMADLAESYAEAGRVAEALPLFSASQAREPGNGALAMKLVGLSEWLGENDDHEAICRRMFAEYAANRTSDGERISKVACLRPISDPEIRATALQIARSAVESSVGATGYPWAQMTLGLAEYRNGLHDEAERHLAAVEQSAQSVRSLHSNQRSALHSTSGFYRAMSLFELGRKDEALALFDDTAGRMKPLPVDALSPLEGGADHDDLIAWLAYREARSLVYGQVSGSTSAVLIAPDSWWRWLHPGDGSDPATSEPDFHANFSALDYDDASWTESQDGAERDRGFGYGNHWFEGIDIGAPQDASSASTAYFRHRFKTEREHPNLELRCQRDDGIIVYLDGQEVARDNMGKGPESHSLRASASAGDDVVSETRLRRIPIAVPLPAGEHVLAISLHDCGEGRPDLRLGGITLLVAIPDPQEIANYYKAAGRPAEALPYLAELVQKRPGDTEFALRVAALHQWLGEEEEYLVICQRMLEWAADSVRTDDLERIAKIQCIEPISDQARRAATLAVAKRGYTLSNGGKWSEMTLGMAHYRIGAFAEADQILATAQEAGPSTWGAALVRTTAGLYHAMSRFRQGDESGARQLFSDCEKAMKPLPADEANPLAGGANYNDLILWMAYKEAAQLLGVSEAGKDSHDR